MCLAGQGHLQGWNDICVSYQRNVTSLLIDSAAPVVHNLTGDLQHLDGPGTSSGKDNMRLFSKPVASSLLAVD